MSTEQTIKLVEDAARRRESIARVSIDKLADLLDQFLATPTDDGAELQRIKQEVKDTDPTVCLETLAFHALLVKNLKDPSSKLKKARAALTKAEDAAGSLRAELTRLQADYARRIEDADEAVAEADAHVADAQLDADRFTTLKGDDVVASSAEYASDVLRAWAKQNRII